MSPQPGDQAARDRSDVERVLLGDTDAFENIVRRWQGPLVNLAFHFCHERSRAEDMAQEAFLRAFRGLASWRGDESFSTWLFALAWNVYWTELLRIPLDLLDEIIEPVESRVVDLEDVAKEQAVRKAVATLPKNTANPSFCFTFWIWTCLRQQERLAFPRGR